MKKRWTINNEACWAAFYVHLFTGFTATLLTPLFNPCNSAGKCGFDNKHLYIHDIIALAYLIVPYALALLAITGYGVYHFITWLLSADGWFIRRETVPVKEDLRKVSK